MDGVCTSEFTTGPNGVYDILSDADNLGTEAELFGGTPYRYRPIRWTETYPDPNATGRTSPHGSLPPDAHRATTGDRSLLPGVDPLDLAQTLAAPAIDPGPGDDPALSGAVLAGIGAGVVAGTPVLKGTPYHPDEVASRVAPPYDPVHERPGYISHSRKSPEPADARKVYESGRLVRTDTETWWGRSEDGKKVYRFRSSQSGDDGARKVHWNGDFDPAHHDVPKEVKRSSTFLRTAGATARVLGPIGLVPMFFDFVDIVDRSRARPPDA